MIKTTIAFALGCVLFLQLPDMPSMLWLWASVVASIVLLIPSTRFVAIMMFGALWTLWCSHLILTDQLSDNLIGQDLVITGTVANVPERHQRHIRFEFTTSPANTIAVPKKLRLNWYQPLPDKLNAGDKWQLTVRLKPPHGMMNRGTFDYEGWLFQQGIGATGYVRSTASNKRLASASVYSINAIREKLAHQIHQHLGNSPNVGLIQGLTAGIRHNITPQQWQILRLSGTSHLLAISGLHIGLSALLGFLCFRWLWVRRSNNLLLLPANKAAAIVGFLTAGFYAAMAGFAIPTQRALIMVGTALFALLVARPVAGHHILALSALLILAYDPLAVLSAGFWLSFTAVSIILLIHQNRFPSPSMQWLKLHGLIALGISPLLLLFFMQTSLIAPIANLFAVPFISIIVVPIVLLASVVVVLYQPAGVLLFKLADALITLFWPLLDWLATLPFSHWNLQQIPRLYWLPIVLGTLILLMPKRMPAKWLGLIGLLPLIFSPTNKPQHNEFWFTMIDVGQGLAAIIQTQHHTLLFDTGPRLSESFNAGSAIIAPLLQQHAINTIDTLIVSHGDNDHIGGARSIIEQFTVKQILSSTPDLLSNATACIAGQSWQWDGVSFTMLHPQQHEQEIKSDNNLSCVLKITTDVGSVLLTGDIEHKAEQLLIKRYPSQLKATILVAPHHGSKTSSSSQFIARVDPDIVLFPTGFHNRFHFPAKAIINRYSKKNSSLYTSADHGAIEFKFHRQNLSPALTWRQHARKIWTYQSSSTDE